MCLIFQIVRVWGHSIITSLFALNESSLHDFYISQLEKHPGYCGWTYNQNEPHGGWSTPCPCKFKILLSRFLERLARLTRCTTGEVLSILKLETMQGSISEASYSRLSYYGKCCFSQWCVSQSRKEREEGNKYWASILC